MSARVKAAAATLALAFVLAVPVHALAATAPAAGGQLDLQAWPDNGTFVVVTAVTVPRTTKLPTKVRVPVPAGAQVQWAGEVLGGDPSNDPSRKYTLKNSPVGGRYAEFTIETTRSAQVDSFMPILKTSGTTVSASFIWTQSVSAPVTTFSLRIPAGGTNVHIEPQTSAAAAFDAQGQALYEGDPMQPKPGSKTRVSLSYTTGSAKAATPVAGSGNSSLLYILLAALTVAIAMAIVIVLKQREAAGSDDEDDEDDEEYEADDEADDADDTADGSRRRGSPGGSDDDWGFIDSDD